MRSDGSRAICSFFNSENLEIKSSLSFNSPEYLSIPSIMAETLASVAVAPFPLYTDIAPFSAIGLIDENTGIPTRSRLVMSATLVMPAAGILESMRDSVSSGARALCVSSLYLFKHDLSLIRASRPGQGKAGMPYNTIQF